MRRRRHAAWSVVFVLLYVGLVATADFWTRAGMPPIALFWPATGVLGAYVALVWKRAIVPVVVTVVGTALAFGPQRILVSGQNETAAAALEAVAVLTLVGVFALLTRRYFVRFRARPAKQTLAFCAVAAVSCATGAVVACWSGDSDQLLQRCATYAGADFVGMIVVGAFLYNLALPGHPEIGSRASRLAGLSCLVGSIITLELSIQTDQLVFLLVSTPLILAGAALSDFRVSLAAATIHVAALSSATAAGVGALAMTESSTANLLAANTSLAVGLFCVAAVMLEFRQQSSELSAIVDALPSYGAIIDSNYQSQRVFVPRKFRVIHPRPTRPVFEFISPQDLEAAMDRVDRALHGETGHLELELDIPEWGERIFSFSVSPVRDDRVLALGADITEQRQLAAERDWEAARYRSIADGLGQGLAELDVDSGLIIYANQSWADIVNWPRDQLIGRRMAAPLTQISESQKDSIRRRLSEREVTPFEFSFLADDGSTRWVRINATRLKNPTGGRSLLVLANDISDLRRAESRRSELENQMQRVEQLERRRIAQELHDSPVQMLTAVGLRLGMLQQNSPELADELAKLEAVVGTSIGEMRELIGGLVPPDVSAGRLIPALKQYVDGLYGDTVPVRYVDTTDAVPTGQIGVTAFQIAHEALSNAILHAGATEVIVRLASVDGGFEIAVVDDGVGLNLSDMLGEPGHLGLRSLFENAATVGGTCYVWENPVGGTIVRAFLPAQSPPAIDLTDHDSPGGRRSDSGSPADSDLRTSPPDTKFPLEGWWAGSNVRS